MSVDELEREEVTSKETARPYFDEFGRCIPTALTAPAHIESRRYFLAVQPQVDYSEIYNRLNECFGFSEQLSLAAFKQRAEAIIESLRNDDEYSNITQGVAVPFILPKAVYNDIGEALENDYLTAVDKSFHTKFPKYSFVNHSVESLTGKFGVAEGSRHEKLLEAMKQDVVVGYYFPSLLEYSVPAAIEQVGKLPDKFLLAGGFDTAAAFIGSPDLLLREDGYPPLLWLSGLSTDSQDAGYHFEAYGYGLTFNRRAHLGHVAEYWASGLVVIG
ncbi:MAG: hypothetical protein JKY54_04220 [Flavobacteriales bacterium]|nr:hypothetical protein [Flavobacteriales bacterium]